MTNEIEQELQKLPPGFYGTVEITYQNGVPGLLRITKTKKLNANPNRKSLGDHNDKQFSK